MCVACDPAFVAEPFFLHSSYMQWHSLPIVGVLVLLVSQIGAVLGSLKLSQIKVFARDAVASELQGHFPCVVP